MYALVCLYSLCMQEIVGHKYLEVIGSEIHNSTADFLISNHRIHHLHKNISGVAAGVGPCRTCGIEDCVPPSVQEELMQVESHVVCLSSVNDFCMRCSSGGVVCGYHRGVSSASL